MILWIFIVMLGLFAIGLPVAWSMAMAAAVYMVLGAHVSLHAVAQRMVGGLDNFPLLAVPFFILAGNLMNSGGITDRLVTFARVLVGSITGGLAHTVVVANMIMAGMSGSGVADAAGTGTVLISAMKRSGYGVPFSAAIVGAASTIGPIIPPSIPFVIYGSMAGVSIGRLFLAGATPGVMMGLTLMVFAYAIARQRHFPRERRASGRDLVAATIRVLPSMGMPVIIMGGIIGGIMTPTEAAAAGAVYALVLGAFVYREIKISDLPGILLESAVTAGAVGIILAAASPIGWVLTVEQAPATAVALVGSAHLNVWQLLLIINVILLILGCVMDGIAILIMVIPLIMPMILQAGIDPVHFGVVFAINIMIGTITPPVGMIMYVVCQIGNISIVEFSREIWPFVIALILALALVTFLPGLAMWLPNLLMPVSRP
jgi:tripartite ATP-independent transporter DctM subunit